MLDKTLRFLLISYTLITSVVKVSSKSVELDKKGNQQLNQEVTETPEISIEAGSDDEVREENAENVKWQEKNGKEEHLNQENTKTPKANIDAGSDGEETEYAENPEQTDTGNEESNKMEAKSKNVALWKMDDVSDKNFEPGFDLTPEEMQKFKIWKDGVIPYYIDVVSFSDKVLRDKIRNYLHMVNTITSLNFMELPNPPYNDDERWVFFLNRRGLLGCADHTVKNFTNRGVQKVVLGYDCIATKGELAEAVMSIAGVPAQHNAPDRDEYITVNTENIMPDKRSLFVKVYDDEWLFHDLMYDIDSVTHYDIHKYSINGRATIQLKKDSTDINPAKALSNIDILKIKMLYNYITRNKKLQVPDCQKLFEPSKHFGSFVPARKQIKPRKKPSRYLGLQDAEVGINEEDHDKEDERQSAEEDNQNQNEDKEQNKEKEGDETSNDSSKIEGDT